MKAMVLLLAFAQPMMTGDTAPLPAPSAPPPAADGSGMAGPPAADGMQGAASADPAPPSETAPATGPATEPEDSSVRIVGGDLADRNEAPWQMQLVEMYKGKPWLYCGAALIDPQWAVTARHCAPAGRDGRTWDQVLRAEFRLRGGDIATSSRTMQEFRIVEIVQFGSFAPPENKRYWAQDDIMLLRLDRPALTTGPNRIAVINLPTTPNVRPKPGSPVWVTGWGNTEARDARVSVQSVGNSTSDLLKVARLAIIDPVDCATQNRSTDALPPTVICAQFRRQDLTRADTAGVRTTCQGDSGGPLVLQRAGRPELVGVVSASRGCSNFPTTYVNVAAYAEQIRREIDRRRAPAAARR